MALSPGEMRPHPPPHLSAEVRTDSSFEVFASCFKWQGVVAPSTYSRESGPSREDIAISSLGPTAVHNKLPEISE